MRTLGNSKFLRRYTRYGQQSGYQKRFRRQRRSNQTLPRYNRVCNNLWSVLRLRLPSCQEFVIRPVQFNRERWLVLLCYERVLEYLEYEVNALLP